MTLNPEHLKPGEEQHEGYCSDVLRRGLVQYDFRDLDGELFSCVKPTLERCRQARDHWLAGKEARTK